MAAETTFTNKGDFYLEGREARGIIASGVAGFAIRADREAAAAGLVA